MDMIWIVIALIAAWGIFAVAKAGSRKSSAGNPGQRYSGSMAARKETPTCKKCGHALCESGRKAFTDGYMLVTYRCPACGDSTWKRVAAGGRQSSSGNAGFRYSGSDYREEEEQETGTRIDHPHYITDDESECSVCGARFPDKLSACPRCGARFGSVKEDDEEWDEEFDEECDMDEEEGW